MLVFFSVKNFRGFKDTLSLDLSASSYEFNHECVKDGIAYKALVYGFNGVGKSNLGLAIMDIIIHLTDKEKTQLLQGAYQNAEAENKISEFVYRFKFHDSILEYRYGKDTPQTLVYEYLSINNKEIVSYNRVNQEPLKIDLSGTETLQKDISKIPISIVKYISRNAAPEPSAETRVLASFFNFVDKMLIFKNLDDRFYAGYEVGSAELFGKIIEKNHFDDFTKFLTEAKLPSNLKHFKVGDQHRVFFSFPKGKNKSVSVLFDEAALIDFYESCSTGMKSLLVFFHWVQNAMFGTTPPSFIFIDEFDAFYHQQLAEFVVSKVKQIKSCQFILTTHDTSVMSNDIMRPDCLFLMQDNKVKALSTLTERELRLAHNIEKMYRAGAFNG
jgi:AAA15 family ATPase/GTPase